MRYTAEDAEVHHLNLYRHNDWYEHQNDEHPEPAKIIPFPQRGEPEPSNVIPFPQRGQTPVAIPTQREREIAYDPRDLESLESQEFHPIDTPHTWQRDLEDGTRHFITHDPDYVRGDGSPAPWRLSSDPPGVGGAFRTVAHALVASNHHVAVLRRGPLHTSSVFPNWTRF